MVEPRSSKPLAWVRFLLSLIVVTNPSEPLLLKPSLNHTYLWESPKKKGPDNFSKTNTKTRVRVSKIRQPIKKLFSLKDSSINSKLRGGHYSKSKNTRSTQIFFKFVKTSSTQTAHQITYPKFLVSHLKTLPSHSTGLRSQILVLRDKFALYEIYKDSVLLGSEPRLPNLKLHITRLYLSSVLTPTNLPLLDNTAQTSESSVNPLACRDLATYLNGTFTGLSSYRRSFNLSKQANTFGQLHSNHLTFLRAWQSFKNQLSFRLTIKWFNIHRRKDFRRYYTFYSHYEDTVRDQRSYRRVMLPKFKDSRRGSLWVLPKVLITADNTANSTVKDSSGKSFRVESSQALVSNPSLRSSRAPLKTSIKQYRLNSRILKSTRLGVTPRKLSRLRVKRFRRLRRSLRWFFRRFQGLHGYLRRSLKRHKRKFKRFVYRFIKSRKRRARKSLFKLSRSFSRRRYFRVLRRRVKRLLKRRFKLPMTLKKRFKHRRSVNSLHILRKVIRSNRRMHVLLSRPSFHKLKSNLMPFSRNINYGFSSLSPSSTITYVGKSESTKAPHPVSIDTASTFLFDNNLELTGLSPFKYLLSNQASFKQTSYYSLKNLITQVQQKVYSYSKALTACRLDKSNLWSLHQTGYSIRRKFLRLIASSSFSSDLSFWYYKTLIQFIENCSGKRTNLYFGPFIENSLTFEDRARCTLWNNRVTGFQRIMGHRIFVYEALSIVAVAIRIKDPTFLANWIRGMLKRLSFWRYRLIFRYLKFLLRYIFQPNFHLFDFRGVKLSLKGKISVAGNARTRTLFMRFGDTSHSKMDNKVSYDLSLVNTFTGVLGFKLLFYY